MAALAERRIIPHEELKARAEEKSEAEARPEAIRDVPVTKPRRNDCGKLVKR